MTHWYVKDLSKLTKVSVQTLHYYDKLNLLKPSLRLDNGYRLYSEADLLKLQQILALKFFGFELSQIKALLASSVDVVEHFTVQSQFLQKKATALIEASNTLQSIISDCGVDKSIPWKTVLKLIEVYQMTQQLEHSWVKDIFTPEELKQYAAFESELKSRPEQKESIKKNLENLVEQMHANLACDPQSAISINIAKNYMSQINELYGKKYAHLRTKKLEKGFGEGKGLEESSGLTPEIMMWLEKAMDAYWRQRLYNIIDQVGKITDSEVLNRWNEALDDMYGEDIDRKAALIKMALSDDSISQTAKDWLKTL